MAFVTLRTAPTIRQRGTINRDPGRMSLLSFYGYSFGALDASQIARMDVVVGKAQASAKEAADLVPNIFTRGWDSIIGASSSVSALKTNAAAADTLYRTLAAKRDRLAADPNATEYDVQEMEGATYAMGNEAAQAAADQLSLSAAYDQVVVQSASDLADAVKNPFGIPLWVWGAGAAAILILWKMPRRR